jgi:hypothetical protein
MANLFNYMDDGAKAQAKGVLAYLQQPDGIEKSYCDEEKRYLAEPKISRWENCREQGYVIYMRSRNMDKQINIAFFEHRNSDEICAIKWEQLSTNAITIDTMKTKDVYNTKWDISHSVPYGQVSEMADWIYKELETFWMSTLESKKKEKLKTN